MVGCGVLGCKSRSERKIDGITFHSFPSEAKTKAKWQDATGRKNWQPTKFTKLCSIHFDKDLFIHKDKRVILKPHSVPQKYPHMDDEMENKKVFTSDITRDQKPLQNNLYDEIYKENVFSSDITRGQKPLENNLYDLVKVVPATPTVPKPEKECPCNFQPLTDKFYIPKKRNRLFKVKTVRDIRRTYEIDVLTDLSQDLEKQQKVLFKKITAGSAREDTTKALAKDILKCDNPVSRTAWQMLMTLNPEGHAHAIQYVLWNGRRIRVNGSKGGKNNFLCNYDLAKRRTRKRERNKNDNNKKLGLIQNSLTINFKPGPLSKKKKLDNSFQKYNLGETELIDLPKVGLDIQPTYGVVLESNIAQFVQKLRDIDGTISEKWAEFAVSVLGTLKNSEPTQTNGESGVTFDLNYKNNQNKMLMRRDLDCACRINSKYQNFNTLKLVDTATTTEIKTIIDEMIESVEISLQQNNMYTGDEEPRRKSIHEDRVSITASKDKNKKRCSELDRLDVTIIRLPEASKMTSDVCKKTHCSLGCVCSSLQCGYNLKQHCGRLECMFGCKCDFSKYKAVDSLDSNCPDLIPGLLNLDNELNMKLAKEEQKFHQTVVMTGEKSILLKPEKRNWKASKRYGDFYSSMCLKNDIKTERALSVVDLKLNLNNVEPWCMVHNLYKCFCKGKFTHDVQSDNLVENNEIQVKEIDDSTSPKCSADLKNISNTRHEYRNVRKETITGTCEPKHNDLKTPEYFFHSTCARVNPYIKRKYRDAYYMRTNKKIAEMEQNDVVLHKKMLSIINRTKEIDTSNDVPNNTQNKVSNTEILVEEDTQDHSAEFPYSEDYPLDNPDKNLLSSNNKTVKTLRDGPINNLPTEISKMSQEHNTENDAAGYSSENSSKSYSVNASSKTLKVGTVSVQKSVFSTISNKKKLVSWLETSYKQYKQRALLEGVTKKSLEPPKHGKVALYPWEFILGRYSERKNLFMVSKQKPFRIFMAIDSKNSFFDNCINIDDIRFADLNQYPATIKNLLTNASDLKDNFCILCGLSNCWELIGSVTKVTDRLQDTENSSEQEKISEEEPLADEDSSRDTCTDNENVQDMLEENTSKCKFKSKTVKDVTKETIGKMFSQQIEMQELEDNTTDSKLNTESKWFVMTIENDFNEIQFYNKGFFVKYESIIKAINVARMSGKTVRLSSQKCGDQSNNPQFGIYAIPNANEYYVFVGPYDKDEPLGIETVKSIADITKPVTTRGVWITTKKVDNIKVIDNPLSFMPPKDLLPSSIIPIETENNPKVDIVSASSTSTQESCNIKNKLIRPIKIRKTDGFYHLASKVCKQSLLKKNIQPSITLKNLAQPSTPFASMKKQTLTSSSCAKSTYICDVAQGQNKPVAEIAPQIKIVNVFSTSGNSDEMNVCNIKPEGGMFILKPEEINKRVMANRMTPMAIYSQENQSVKNNANDKLIDQDIENFISNSVECTDSNTDALIISDEEDNLQNTPFWKEIWIVCQNNEHLGWIRGKKNRQNQISFEFPGFLFTDYYDSEEEVFSKINQVLSRKIYVPKSIKLEWSIVECADDLKGRPQLKAQDLGSDFVLTKRGLRHKRDLMANSMSLKAFSSRLDASSQLKTLLSSEVDKAVDVMSELEERCKSLDDQGDMLIGKLQLLNPNRNVIAKQENLPETLHNIISGLNDNINEV